MVIEKLEMIVGNLLVPLYIDGRSLERPSFIVDFTAGRHEMTSTLHV